MSLEKMTNLTMHKREPETSACTLNQQELGRKCNFVAE